MAPVVYVNFNLVHLGVHALKLLHHVLNSLRQTIGACPAAAAAVASEAAALHYADKKFKTARLCCNNFSRETHSIISASQAKCMRRVCVCAWSAASENTAQLVPSSLNFHKCFALSLSVPLTGCTDALMRFSCRPSEKLFHPRNYIAAETCSCSLEIGWLAWEAEQMFLKTGR
jgi:hypothetical protein